MVGGMFHSKKPSYSPSSHRRIGALRGLATISGIVGSLLLATGCGAAATVRGPEENITDVPHTAVERQSIGNCWLYADATWAESMHLAATGEEFDISQSYWTYWHWFNELQSTFGEELQTGGSHREAAQIARERGLMAENDFIADDGVSEMSARQKEALTQINFELKEGRLADPDSRQDTALIRSILDEAWRLSDETRAMLDGAFGEDGERTLDGGGPSADTDGTPIVDIYDFAAQYTRFDSSANTSAAVDSNLGEAINDWREVSFPSFSTAFKRREFFQRVQRALHNSQPVIIRWAVDFNAMSSFLSEVPGAFSLANLNDAKIPGRQGGHMTVLEDYQAVTPFGELLEAGVTLDPSVPEDAQKLTNALDRYTEIQFFRVKNSWGGFRDDRTSVPGFPGYHDLYMDYLTSEIPWCPDAEEPKSLETCTGTRVPLGGVVLPPGY